MQNCFVKLDRCQANFKICKDSLIKFLKNNYKEYLFIYLNLIERI
ncbi:hypothetical protein ATCC51561_1411 [Campylobacter concisus ATCC 51561]|nr:hypothetical protein ATCC51561_1411 [Campylobacter concisus ATCC 51561]